MAAKKTERPTSGARVPTRRRFVRGTDQEVVRAKTLVGGRERLIWVEKLGPQKFGNPVDKTATELR
ncbi:MAG: hypothetical protein GWN71_21720 [Gammaproteobacteria bacterium]|nr:hypothetical protein [Gemmatimonadota bacterium]NIR35061.1 hypothetical protein [Actinomycetota bacterium]NIU76087.1 hypothetical protein [Gammaproteobacteria bacterium]NIY09938.1 hypothetical protein [Gemmatimonadota bacterium]